MQGDVNVYADYSTDEVNRLLEAVARGNKPEIGQEDAMDETILAHMEHMRFRRALHRRTAFSPRNVALPANSRSHPADFH